MKGESALQASLVWKKAKSNTKPIDTSSSEKIILNHGKVGIIAGSGEFPVMFCKRAKEHDCKSVVVAHEGETDKSIEDHADQFTWIKLGQLGKLISFFKANDVKAVVMAGGISRVKHFGDLKLDLKGVTFLAKTRSTKDDVVMRGIASELESEGIEVVSCLSFFSESTINKGIFVGKAISKEEKKDIDVGIEAIKAMSSQDIGQLVVVKQGVVVAVEAVEGTDATIVRGGQLAGEGSVVVKFTKPTQDLRFDVPTIGVETIKTLNTAKVRVLALEAGKNLVLDLQGVLNEAKSTNLTIIGI